MSYDGWKTRSDGDEYPERTEVRTCAAPDCLKAFVAQIVDVDTDECPYCGFSWETEASPVCPTCGKVSTLTGDSDRTKCAHCGAVA